MEPPDTEPHAGRRTRWWWVALAIGGLTVLLAVVFATCAFVVRKVVDHPGTATQARFAEIDDAVAHARPPAGYTLVFSQRPGSLSAFDDQGPEVARIYSVPPTDAVGVAAKLRASLAAQGFSGGRPHPPSCLFMAHRGNVTIQVQFFPTFTRDFPSGSRCPDRSWTHVYVYTVFS